MVTFEDLPERVKGPLIAFKNQTIKSYNPLGIILVGSFAKGYAGPHSDLDVYIVVEDQDWRERGNLWIDGVEIEYFINPVKQINSYLEQEERIRPNTADMLGTGVVLYQRDPIIDDLIKAATEILDQGVKPLEGIDLELTQYTLDDIKKDLRDLREETGGYAYQQTLWHAITLCNKAILHYYESYAERVKIRMEQFNQLDTTYADLLQSVVNTPKGEWNAIKLIEYVEGKIGSRPKEWKLRGDLRL